MPMVVVCVAIVVAGSVGAGAPVVLDDESDEESVHAASTAAPDTTMNDRREKRCIDIEGKIVTAEATVAAFGSGPRQPASSLPIDQLIPRPTVRRRRVR